MLYMFENKLLVDAMETDEYNRKHTRSQSTIKRKESDVI